MAGPLDGLPADAQAFIQQQLAAGNAVLEVLRPPSDIFASIYVTLARPCQAATQEAGARVWSFGEMAPGLPAVVVLGSESYLSDAVPEIQTPARTPTQPPARPTPKERGRREPTLLQRFERSMVIDHEAWHDGTGYDLDAIDEASTAQREDMLDLLRATGLHDWRDIEAVARIGGRAARQVLRRAWRHGGSAQRMAMLEHAPDIVTERQRVAAIVEALGETRLYEGLSPCLDQLLECHPPAVMQALWSALERPEAEVTVHVAAMLMYLHGLAEAPFDWNQRNFYLRFGSEDAAERKAALGELQQRIGGRAA